MQIDSYKEALSRLRPFVFLFRGGPSSPEVKTAEERPGPRTPEEEIVSKHIRETANDPKSVEFLKWGPHLSMSEVREVAKKKGLKGVGASAQVPCEWLVRVCYRAKNAAGVPQFHDELFMVTEKHAVFGKGGENQFGDQWRDWMIPGLKGIGLVGPGPGPSGDVTLPSIDGYAPPLLKKK